MKKQKVIILGSSGFLGGNITKALVKFKKFKLYGTYFKNKPNIKGVKFIKVDLTKEKNVDKVLKGKNIVIHSAAITSGSKEVTLNPIKFVSDNVIMNSLICKHSTINKVNKVILLSCSIVYATHGSKKVFVKEDDLNLKNNIYQKYFGFAWIKIYLEKMAEFYASFKQTKFIVLRHSNIYGPNDKFDPLKSHVLASLILKSMDKKQKIIEILGNGNESRDLLFVSDFVDALKKIISKNLGYFKVYNVGSGKLYTINQLASFIKKITQSKKKIVNNNKYSNLNTNIALDCKKIKNEINWKSETEIKLGIEKTIKWYRKYKLKKS